MPFPPGCSAAQDEEEAAPTKLPIKKGKKLSQAAPRPVPEPVVKPAEPIVDDEPELEMESEDEAVTPFAFAGEGDDDDDEPEPEPVTLEVCMRGVGLQTKGETHRVRREERQG